MKKFAAFAFGIGLAVLLSACGGGGDDGPAPPVTPPATTFPLRQSWVNVLNQTETKTFTISGSINAMSIGGSGNATFGGLASTTFESKSALSKTSVVTGTVIVGNQSAPFGGTSVLYVDPNYQPLGTTSAGLYGVVIGSVTIPDSAKVNDTGRLYEFNRYSNSSKTVRLGTASVDFALQADSSTTAILKLIITNRSTTGAVEATVLETYRVTTTASVTRLSEQTMSGADSVTVTYGP